MACGLLQLLVGTLFVNLQKAGDLSKALKAESPLQITSVRYQCSKTILRPLAATPENRRHAKARAAPSSTTSGYVIAILGYLLSTFKSRRKARTKADGFTRARNMRMNDVVSFSGKRMQSPVCRVLC